MPRVMSPSSICLNPFFYPLPATTVRSTFSFSDSPSSLRMQIWHRIPQKSSGSLAQCSVSSLVLSNLLLFLWSCQTMSRPVPLKRSFLLPYIRLSMRFFIRDVIIILPSQNLFFKKLAVELSLIITVTTN